MPIINSVISGGGTTPTGTKNITANGVHDVAGYASADVQVPTTAPAYYVEKTKDANNVLQHGSGMNSFTGITNIGIYVCAGMYRTEGNGAQNKILTVDMSDILNLSNYASCENMFAGQGSGFGYYTELNIDLSNLVSITGRNACYQMFNMSESLINSYAKLNINLASLQTINGTNACNGMFRGFSAISGYLIDFTFPSLKTIDGSRSCVSMFEANRIIKKLLFPELKSISGSTSVNSLAKDATFLTESSFDKLDTISIQMGSSSQPMFGGCVALESVSFGGVKASTFSGTQNQLQYLFNSSTGSTATGGCTVHFPSNFDPSDPNHTFDASTLTGYPTFGGDANYIHLAYDLPATES